MTGFAVVITYGTSKGEGGNVFVPGEPGEPLVQTRVAGGIKLLGWGAVHGDVRVSVGVGPSVLILHGYVSDPGVLAEGRDQQKVCEEIHKRVAEKDAVTSIQAILGTVGGCFALVYANWETGEVVVGTDRLMARPLWYGKGEGMLVVASNPLAVAQVLRIERFDLGSLGSLMLYGAQVDPSFSIFEGVRAVEEGTVLRFRCGHEAQRERWYKFRYLPDRNVSYRGWVDLATRSVLEAARRTLACSLQPLVFLSGGLDSRLTAAALSAVGGKPLLVTLGDSENLEVRIAQKVARALRLPHMVIIRDRLWYLLTLQRSVFETGGGYVWTHGHFAKAFREIQKETGCVSAYLGFGCEAFSKLLAEVKTAGNQIWKPDRFAAEFDDIVPPKYRPASRAQTLALFRGDVRGEVEQQLIDRIEARCSRIVESTGEAAITASQFLDWEAVTAHPTYFNVLDVRSAGMERNLMFESVTHSLLEIMPVEMRDGRNLGARVIKRLCAAAAAVPNANTLLPIVVPRCLGHLVAVTRPWLGKLRRCVFENSYRTTDSWPLLPLLYRDDVVWRGTCEKYLIEEIERFDADIFDRDAIRRCWREFVQHSGAKAQDVERLLEVAILIALWQEAETTVRRT